MCKFYCIFFYTNIFYYVCTVIKNKIKMNFNLMLLFTLLAGIFVIRGYIKDKVYLIVIGGACVILAAFFWLSVNSIN